MQSAKGRDLLIYHEFLKLTNWELCIINITKVSGSIFIPGDYSSWKVEILLGQTMASLHREYVCIIKRLVPIFPSVGTGHRLIGFIYLYIHVYIWWLKKRFLCAHGIFVQVRPQAATLWGELWRGGNPQLWNSCFGAVRLLYINRNLEFFLSEFNILIGW